ncbi:MAG: hypothetical protein A2X85_17450 [Geobacteraceae bacterium GWF2_54_21]|nr:MAG: hypothetical protein A2X85_17450 [Geobacteraceae bacterium GWF2_54_21]
MSKRIDAAITCKKCQHNFNVSLYRSIWVEDPENRRLIFEDMINRVTCPNCSDSQRLEFPFLCTNVKSGIAIWYEPYYDPAIDDDVKLYAAQFGKQSFYALAPRIKDWEDFKKKLLEMDKSLNVNAMLTSKPIEKQIIPRYNESDESLSTIKAYPKFLSHLRKNKNRLLYSAIPVIAFISFLITKNGNTRNIIDDIFPIIGVFLLFSSILYVILTSIHIAIVEAKPWRNRSKVFRVWCFLSGCWIAGIPVIYMLSDEGLSDWWSDRFNHMLLIMLLPPFLIGLATYIYQKYVK